MSNRIFALPLLMFITFPVVLLAGEHVTETQKFSYPLASGGSFEIDNLNGKIDINSWDQSQLGITATKEANSQAELDAIRIDVKQQSDAIEVRTSYSPPGPHNGGVSYQVMLPKDIGKVVVKTANGSISAKNVGGNVDMKSENGAISATDLKGPFSLDTTNGAVEAVCADLMGDSKLKTTNGPITLTLPRSTDVLIDADTVVGRIESNLPAIKSSKGFVGQTLQAKLGAGAHHIEAKTTNGSIYLKAE
jgi:hypothetical protein